MQECHLVFTRSVTLPLYLTEGVNLFYLERNTGIQKAQPLTESKSNPLASRVGTADDRLLGLHCGYSCQFVNLLTPGQTSSFGVPSNLHQQRN